MGDRNTNSLDYNYNFQYNYSFKSNYNSQYNNSFKKYNDLDQELNKYKVKCWKVWTTLYWERVS